jgi:hypothetical protein
MKVDWEDVVSTSHLDAISQVKQLIEEHNYDEAVEGLNELYENMANSEKRALESQLIRLMSHILKWKYQPNKTSTSWVRSIVNSRIEIEKLQKFMPSLNKNYVLSVWDDCFLDSIKVAKAEMGISQKTQINIQPLTWQEVFEDDYFIEDND